MPTKRLRLTKAEIQEHHASLLWLKSIGIPVSGADELSHPPVRLKLLQVDHELAKLYSLPVIGLVVVVRAKLLVLTGGLLITDSEMTIPCDPLPLDLSDPEASAYYEDVIYGSIPYPPILLNGRLTGEVPLRRGQVEGMIIAKGWSSVPPQYHDHKQVPIELSLWDECGNELSFAFWARVDRSVKRKYEWLEHFSCYCIAYPQWANQPEAFLAVTGCRASEMACSKQFEGASLGRAEVLFDFGPSFFDGIKVRRIGRQVQQCSSGRFDPFPHAGHFMGGQVIGDHDLPRLQAGTQHRSR